MKYMFCQSDLALGNRVKEAFMHSHSLKYYVMLTAPREVFGVTSWKSQVSTCVGYVKGFTYVVDVLNRSMMCLP